MADVLIQASSAGQAYQDKVCATLHRWEQRCFAAIKFLGALALLLRLIILKVGLIAKTIHVEFGTLETASWLVKMFGDWF